jgi:hypothetical protein
MRWRRVERLMRVVWRCCIKARDVKEREVQDKQQKHKGYSTPEQEMSQNRKRRDIDWYDVSTCAGASRGCVDVVAAILHVEIVVGHVDVAERLVVVLWSYIGIK